MSLFGGFTASAMALRLQLQADADARATDDAMSSWFELVARLEDEVIGLRRQNAALAGQLQAREDALATAEATVETLRQRLIDRG
jgi:hypothetical protein